MRKEKDRIEFEKGWSQCAGHHSESTSILDEVLRRAGQYFAMGLDKEATVLRTLATNYLQPRVKDHSERLQEYINENRTA